MQSTFSEQDGMELGVDGRQLVIFKPLTMQQCACKTWVRGEQDLKILSAEQEENDRKATC